MTVVRIRYPGLPHHGSAEAAANMHSCSIEDTDVCCRLHARARTQG